VTARRIGGDFERWPPQRSFSDFALISTISR